MVCFYEFIDELESQILADILIIADTHTIYNVRGVNRALRNMVDEIWDILLEQKDVCVAIEVEQRHPVMGLPLYIPLKRHILVDKE
jgi:hypothetical protein